MFFKILIFVIYLVICNAYNYTNPVYNHNFPDPFILSPYRFPNNSTTLKLFYGYGTFTDGYNFQVMSSVDTVKWDFHGEAMPKLARWASTTKGFTWAPTVLGYSDNRFIMFYVARSEILNTQCIGRAIANSPLGPFVDDSDSPMICQKSIGGSIDPSYHYVESTKSFWLVWKNDGNSIGNLCHIWTQQLSSDCLSVVGSPTILISRDQDWEGVLVEAPTITLIGNTYYLLYSAQMYNTYLYSVGFAKCASHEGPCIKPYQAPVLIFKGLVWGPGGAEFYIDQNKNLMICYHGYTAPYLYTNGGFRSLRIDKVEINKYGDIDIRGPTFEPVIIQK